MISATNRLSLNNGFIEVTQDKVSGSWVSSVVIGTIENEVDVPSFVIDDGHVYLQGSISLEGGAKLFSGTGAPSNSAGSKGDVYVRTGGTPGVYQKQNSSTWLPLGAGDGGDIIINPSFESNVTYPPISTATTGSAGDLYVGTDYIYYYVDTVGWRKSIASSI